MPVLKLSYYGADRGNSNYLQSPHLFVCADLCTATDPAGQDGLNNALAGTTVSSLHRLKDIDNAGNFISPVRAHQIP